MFSAKSLKETLDIVRPLGLQALEIGTGQLSGFGPYQRAGITGIRREMRGIQGRSQRRRPRAQRAELPRELSASGQGFCEEMRRGPNRYDRSSPEKLGVKVVIDFSGCPGSDAASTKPNWVTCAWPPDYLEILDWQWNERVIPFWKKQAKFAADHGVKVAFEMHPGFVVYNTATMLRLRKECGNNLGANFDPSHLFWQGMEPIECVRALGKAIFHVHAKDTAIDAHNTAVNGVLDIRHYSDVVNRLWVFRTCGYGHTLGWWKNFVSMLRIVGYDGVLSIEHEDSLMSNMEGLTKAVEFFKQVLIFEKPSAMTWA